MEAGDESTVVTLNKKHKKKKAKNQDVNESIVTNAAVHTPPHSAQPPPISDLHFPSPPLPVSPTSNAEQQQKHAKSILLANKAALFSSHDSGDAPRNLLSTLPPADPLSVDSLEFQIDIADEDKTVQTSQKQIEEKENSDSNSHPRSSNPPLSILRGDDSTSVSNRKPKAKSSLVATLSNTKNSEAQRDNAEREQPSSNTSITTAGRTQSHAQPSSSSSSSSAVSTSSSSMDDLDRAVAGLKVGRSNVSAQSATALPSTYGQRKNAKPQPDNVSYQLFQSSCPYHSPFIQFYICVSISLMKSHYLLLII